VKRIEKNIYKYFLLGAFIFLCTINCSDVFAKEKLLSAPMNPEFLAYMESIQKERILAPEFAYEGRGLGLIPSPLNLDYLTGINIFEARPSQTMESTKTPLRVGLPVSYDLRTQGKLTPVRDQSTGNTCWTFATYGSVESNLLPEETNDFSENLSMAK